MQKEREEQSSPNAEYGDTEAASSQDAPVPSSSSASPKSKKAGAKKVKAEKAEPKKKSYGEIRINDHLTVRYDREGSKSMNLPREREKLEVVG